MIGAIPGRIIFICIRKHFQKEGATTLDPQRALRGGIPDPYLEPLIDPYLEPFCGHSSPKVDKIFLE